MKPVRNTPTAFRFDSTVKDALAVIAERDGRSMANMLEWLIRKHCEREGLGWPPEQVAGTTNSNAAIVVVPNAKKVKSASAKTKNSKLGNKQT